MKNTIHDDRKIDAIITETSRFLGLNPYEIFSFSRKSHITKARQIFHYLAIKHTKKSLVDIGKVSLLYGRGEPHSHSSILHSKKSVKNNMETDKNYLLDVHNIEFCFKSSINNVTDEDKKELTILEINQILEKDLLEARSEVIRLTNVIKTIKNNINFNHKNPYLLRLLSSDEEVVNDFCNTRLRPYFLMNDKKINKKDSVSI